MTVVSFVKRRFALVAVFLVLAFSAAYASRTFRAWRAERTATRSAEWISAGDARRERAPNGYWLARDFEIDTLPKSARLLALGDPEYVLWLNGRRVGSGTYAESSALDAFEVASFLQPGVNRIAVEVRSDRGPSGFLASLDDLSFENAPRPIVVTDSSFRVYRRYDAAILSGVRALPSGAPAYSWSTPPMGRWGEPLVGPTLPTYDAAALAAVSGHAGVGSPPGHFVFHWDAAQTGYLTLEFAARETPQLALLRFYGTEPAAGASPTEALPIPVVVLPARRLWLDAVPRQVRSIEVVGDVQVVAASIAPLAANVALAPRPAPKPRRGVWGLSAPPLRSPVEDEVGRQLERLAGGGGGEKLKLSPR